MTGQKPSVGSIVHYVSYGTPAGEYKSECRAAIVTEITGELEPHGDPVVGLCVLNPTGQFFNRTVPYNAGEGKLGDPECTNPHGNGPHRYCPCGWTEPHHVGGTWHWPERV